MPSSRDPRPFDVATPGGRLRAYWDFLWQDHAVLRLAFRNAHWVADDLARSNQPWPHQLADWKRRGIRTVISLRGGTEGSHHVIERAACEALGLRLVTFRLGSREAPSAGQVRAAKALFETIAYPAVIHCKSGSDRTGLMGTLYLHLRKGLPIRQARRQLGLRFGHLAHGETGLLDYVFERYLAEGEPAGQTFLQWTQSPAYDPVALKAAYRTKGPARWIERLLSRE
ncbi:fused DSP-PTPase phosphatase/NAD kinase-like protein [Phenylobacterium sp.]|uniref:fused DSP-PTPase phosphatase/NAD kinase-like protein n=1 Tax=Phenylobacterium sp. TaxID=1871053 RepID=UPI002DF56279|nr:sulfur transferase domain-containing protein [Phenylobacterium sp.]